MAETLEQRVLHLEERVALLEEATRLMSDQIELLTPKIMTNALDLIRGREISDLNTKLEALQSQFDALSATVRRII